MRWPRPDAVSDFWRSEPPRRPRLAEGGIQARSRRGDIGESWGSPRFIAILEDFEYGSRLERGRHYARRGQGLGLGVRPGGVEGRGPGSRARPRRVRLSA